MLIRFIIISPFTQNLSQSLYKEEKKYILHINICMSLIDHPLIVSKLEAIPKILSKEYLDPQSMTDSEKRAIFTKALPPLLITG